MERRNIEDRKMERRERWFRDDEDSRKRGGQRGGIVE